MTFQMICFNVLKEFTMFVSQTETFKMRQIHNKIKYLKFHAQTQCSLVRRIDCAMLYLLRTVNGVWKNVHTSGKERAVLSHSSRFRNPTHEARGARYKAQWPSATGGRCRCTVYYLIFTCRSVFSSTSSRHSIFYRIRDTQRRWFAQITKLS